MSAKEYRSIRVDFPISSGMIKTIKLIHFLYLNIKTNALPQRFR